MGTGFIDSVALRRMMASLGEKMTDAEIDDMMREADLDGDGKISFAEFHRHCNLNSILPTIA